VPGVSVRDSHVQVQTGVVTHSLWFHQPFDAAAWLRVEVRGQRLAGGRGFVPARSTPGGSLVASSRRSVIRRPAAEDGRTFVEIGSSDDIGTFRPVRERRQVAVITLDGQPRPTRRRRASSRISTRVAARGRGSRGTSHRADDDRQALLGGHDMSAGPVRDGAPWPYSRRRKLVAEQYYDWETRAILSTPAGGVTSEADHRRGPRQCIAAGLMLCWPCDPSSPPTTHSLRPGGDDGHHGRRDQRTPGNSVRGSRDTFHSGAITAERPSGAEWQSCRAAGRAPLPHDAVAYRIAQMDPGRCAWRSEPSTTPSTRWSLDGDRILLRHAHSPHAGARGTGARRS